MPTHSPRVYEYTPLGIQFLLGEAIQKLNEQRLLAGKLGSAPVLKSAPRMATPSGFGRLRISHVQTGKVVRKYAGTSVSRVTVRMYSPPASSRRPKSS
jgi:hypothetical protein